MARQRRRAPIHAIAALSRLPPPDHLRPTVGMFQTLGRVMLSSADTLTLKCLACGHERKLDRKTAFGLFGERATPYDVRSNAYCSVCGERRRIDAWI